MHTRLIYLFLGLIAVLYLGLGWQYATQTPAWQIPDEPAHYNYIRQLAEEGRFPVIVQGDWDSAYQNQLTSSGFDPQYTAEIERIEYEDHQPPLYYLSAILPYKLSNGDLTTLRLWSVLLGLGIVLGTFASINRFFPEQPTLALSAAALTAFIPQHLAMLGGVNNDSLAELLAVWIFFFLIGYLQAESVHWQDAARLGILVGLALLTKSTIYYLAGIVGLGILWRIKKAPLTALPQLAAYLIPALLLGGLWWGRNLSVYGGTDFLGLQRHDEVAAGQLQTTDYQENYLGGDRGEYWQNLVYTTFHSFWGQFGWMAVPMETRLYRVLLGVCLGMLLGSLIYGRLAGWFQTLESFQKEMLSLFFLTIFLVLGAFLFYNRQFVQFQGRYLFPALLPLSLWGALGLQGWVNLAGRFLPPVHQRKLAWIAPVLALSLAVLAWYALHTYLIPNLPHWE